MADVEIDEQGFTRKQRLLLQCMTAVLRGAIDANPSSQAQAAQATRILVAYAGGLISEEEGRSLLSRAQGNQLQVDGLTYEERTSLLEAAIGVVGADGFLDPSETRFVFEIGQRLGLPRNFIDEMVRKLRFSDDATSAGASTNDELPLARDVFGVSATATLQEIKRRYHELLFKFHPDVAGSRGVARDQAEERTKQINWAYAVLKQQAAAAATA